jgi:hypothetical protein
VLLGDEVVADHPRHFRRDQCKRRSKNPSLEATEWFGSSPE